MCFDDLSGGGEEEVEVEKNSEEIQDGPACLKGKTKPDLVGSALRRRVSLSSADSKDGEESFI